MMKKVFIYVGLLLAVSITSISALGPQPIACQSTASTSNAKFTADCALKTLRTKGTYTGYTDRYTYIGRLIDKNGVTIGSFGINSGKRTGECTASISTYYHSTRHDHNYSRYEN